MSALKVSFNFSIHFNIKVLKSINGRIKQILQYIHLNQKCNTEMIYSSEYSAYIAQE